MQMSLIEEKVLLAVQSVMGESKVIATLMDEDILLFRGGLNLSSLDAVMLVVKIEEIFNIKWPDELLNFDNNLSLSEMVKIVNNILGEEEKHVL